ncbi:hypothetical protein [Haloarcula amylovorans]|uniref:hypothetical protein n=1 Tax=Haloarcula amylovorans TaxID=2562280 RepID=UPI00142FDB25|nr:hypothetical protein [Halomicroarcula amylolytica]
MLRHYLGIFVVSALAGVVALLAFESVVGPSEASTPFVAVAAAVGATIGSYEMCRE